MGIVAIQEIKISRVVRKSKASIPRASPTPRTGAYQSMGCGDWKAKS